MLYSGFTMTMDGVGLRGDLISRLHGTNVGNGEAGTLIKIDWYAFFIDHVIFGFYIGTGNCICWSVTKWEADAPWHRCYRMDGTSLGRHDD